MKKTILLTALLAVCVAAFAADKMKAGWGKIIDASTTEATVIIGGGSTGTNAFYGSATKVSIENLDETEPIFAMKNCTTNWFVWSNAVPISAGTVYTFTGSDITHIVYVATNGTPSFAVAAE